MRLEEGAGKIDAQGREGFLSTSGEQLVGQCRPIVHEADGVGVSHGDAHEFEGSPRRIEAQMPQATSASSRSTRYLAKQRTPLPHIWAKVPSALM